MLHCKIKVAEETTLDMVDFSLRMAFQLSPEG